VAASFSPDRKWRLFSTLTIRPLKRSTMPLDTQRRAERVKLMFSGRGTLAKAEEPVGEFLAIILV